jgi:hypothetical protein
VSQSHHPVAAEGMRELTRAVLGRRFGPLSQDVLQALNTADATTLSAAGASDTLEQARAHLGLQQCIAGKNNLNRQAHRYYCHCR